MSDRTAVQYHIAGSLDAEEKPDFVKLGTNATKKVAKYSGECPKNDYIFAIAILTQEKQK
jgi:hypothetical protein